MVKQCLLKDDNEWENLRIEKHTKKQKIASFLPTYSMLYRKTNFLTYMRHKIIVSNCETSMKMYVFCFALKNLN
jgi:hypothetical protein